MKRILSFLFILTLITCLVQTPTASAATSAPSVSTTITRDSDGGYYVEKTAEINTLFSPFASSTYSATAATVDRTKNISYYNSSNVLCWKYSLTGTFRYITGLSAVCTDSRANLKIYNSAYFLYSESHSHSGSTATGTIRIRKQTLITTKTISITCSKNGTFS